MCVRVSGVAGHGTGDFDVGADRLLARQGITGTFVSIIIDTIADFQFRLTLIPYRYLEDGRRGGGLRSVSVRRRKVSLPPSWVHWKDCLDIESAATTVTLCSLGVTTGRVTLHALPLDTCELCCCAMNITFGIHSLPPSPFSPSTKTKTWLGSVLCMHMQREVLRRTWGHTWYKSII